MKFKIASNDPEICEYYYLQIIVILSFKPLIIERTSVKTWTMHTNAEKPGAWIFPPKSC